MEEWHRILASSASGFALGVVEPIRFWLTAKLNQREARLALHRCFAQISIDVNWMLDVIATYEEPEVMTRGELWNGLAVVYTKSDLTVCDYYRNSERTTYYALREATGFNILYSRVGRSLRVLRKIAEDPYAPDALDRVIAEIEEIRRHLDGAATFTVPSCISKKKGFFLCCNLPESPNATTWQLHQAREWGPLRHALCSSGSAKM